MAEPGGQWRGLGQRPCVERSAGHLRPWDPDLKVEIQTTSGDHKMVAPELDGGVLTGSSSDFAAGLGDEDGEVDDGLRMTANSLSYSSVLGAAPLLGFVVPSSGEMRTRSKSMVKSPTTEIEQG